MSYEDIKGQDRATGFLKRVALNGKIAQAYLFLGPSGVGKKLTALNFARALNCGAGQAIRPCGECASCKKISSGNHPDVSLISPEKEGGTVKIEKIRQLIKDISLKPYEARKKVYIIDEADAMTQESANALLMTLEEPPTESVIILIAENLNDILKTIISRSQIIRFLPMKSGDAKRLLVEEHDLDGTNAHIMAHLSSGRIGEAIKFKEGDVFEKRSRIIDALIKRRFFDSDFENTSREELKGFLNVVLTWYRDILVAKTSRGEKGERFINMDREKDLVEESKIHTVEYLENAIQSIISTAGYLDQNANPKLVMSVLGLKIQGAYSPSQNK